MPLSLTDAYTQIKNLENSGKLTLPEQQGTVTVGTIDPATGTFTWSVPTVVQTTVVPPIPPEKTNSLVKVTVGVVSTKAVDLLLRFAVVPLKFVVNEPVVVTNAHLGTITAPAHAVGKPAAATPAPAHAVGTPAAAAPAPAHAVGTPAAAAPAARILNIVGSSNGGTTITGFPTVESAADHITVDAGLASSAALQATNVTPPVTTFSIEINIPGHAPNVIHFIILRPPAVALGAFTIPALPMTIVYAPPQGKQLKNNATYSDSSTLSRTVTSSLSSSNSTKSVQAYTAAELLGKVAGAISAVVAVVGTGGAAAAGGATVAGAMSQLGAALFGGAQDANDSTADAAKQVSSELTLVGDILSALPETTTSTTGSITVQNDHSLALSVTNVATYGSEATLGCGLGDRIVYMKNVKVAWMLVNGEVGINIMGFDGVGANAVQDLLQEAQALESGKAPTLKLDLDTIKSLLAVDLLVPPKHAVLTGANSGPAVIGPPRFVPANPQGRNGSGTSSGGDVFGASYEVVTDDKQTTINSNTTVTDLKPGWVGALFGGNNTETTTTATLTTTQSTDNKTDKKLTSTITLFSEGRDDPYDVKILFDRLFGTYVILSSNSALLVSGSTNTSVLTNVSTFTQEVSFEPAAGTARKPTGT
jgi:hypothetical protein